MRRPGPSHHHEMIADGIEPVAIALPLGHIADGRGPEFFIEHLVAKTLAGRDLVRTVGLTKKQFALFGADVWLALQF